MNTGGRTPSLLCVVGCHHKSGRNQKTYIYIYIVTARQEYHWGMQGGYSVSVTQGNNVNVVPQFISPMNIAIVDPKDLHAGHVKICDDKSLV